MNAKTKSAIIRHGESLIAALPNCTERDPIALCKKLRRIETSLTKPLTDYCNGTFQDDEEGTKLDAICDKAYSKVHAILGKNIPLLINRDPRGHALKLDDAWTREYNHGIRKVPKCHSCGCDILSCKSHDNKEAEEKYHKYNSIYTDMGGYGILAPDLNQ